VDNVDNSVHISFPYTYGCWYLCGKERNLSTQEKVFCGKRRY